MCLRSFALRIETTRLVAIEIADRAVAASLDAGEPILLGTIEDLRTVARRLQLPLVTVARARTPRRQNSPAKGGTSDQWTSSPRVFAEVA